MTNIMSVLGSPRLDGNCAALAKEFCDTAQNLGAQVETHVLNKLKFRWCHACMVCKTKLDRCTIDDDLSDILASIYDTDILVLATPVYLAEVSAQTKTFIDRCFSLLVPGFQSSPKPSRLPPGKTLVFIQAQGQANEKYFDDIYPRYQFIFSLYGFENFHLIRACGVNAPGEVKEKEDVMVLARKTKKKILG